MFIILTENLKGKKPLYFYWLTNGNDACQPVVAGTCYLLYSLLTALSCSNAEQFKSWLFHRIYI